MLIVPKKHSAKYKVNINKTKELQSCEVDVAISVHLDCVADNADRFR